jgi:glycosyltransferase involved in cell wall biosynthesis
MKFTFPILTLSLGGAQRMLAEITNRLVDKGHDVTILMPKYGQVDYPVRATIHRLDKVLMDQSDYPNSDVIVSNYYTTVESAYAASQAGKGVHVRFSLSYEPPFLAENHYSMPTYNLTRHVIVLSSWQQLLIRLMHGIDSHIVPIGVDHQFRNLHVRDRQKVIQISSVVRKPEGGFSPHREQNYLLEELRTIKRRYPWIQVNLICPPGEFYTSPSLLALRDSEKFRFITPKDDTEMCYHYNETDIFVSSSSYDAGSLPGLEAMRCGAALVTIYSGGNQDYCHPNKNCLMSYRYEHRLGKDIEHLILDKELRLKLAMQGQEDSMKWTWERSAMAFEQAVFDIVENKH